MKDVSREWQEVSSYYDPDPPNERDIEKGRFWERHDDIKSDFEWDQRDRLSVQKSIESSRKRWEGGIKPTGNDLLLLPGRVFGFVLKTRSWGESFRIVILSSAFLNYDFSFAKFRTSQGYQARPRGSSRLAAPQWIQRRDSVTG